MRSKARHAPPMQDKAGARIAPPRVFFHPD
jgi:hypothetical protein